MEMCFGPVLTKQQTKESSSYSILNPNVVIQPSTVKAQLREQFNFALGDKNLKCDFSQKNKKMHKVVPNVRLC